MATQQRDGNRVTARWNHEAIDHALDPPLKQDPRSRAAASSCDPPASTIKSDERHASRPPPGRRRSSRPAKGLVSLIPSAEKAERLASGWRASDRAEKSGHIPESVSRLSHSVLWWPAGMPE